MVKIDIKKEIYEDLKELKTEYDLGNISDVIEFLLKVYKKVYDVYMGLEETLRK
jgi:predicted CopG family antitoxin